MKDASITRSRAGGARTGLLAAVVLGAAVLAPIQSCGRSDEAADPSRRKAKRVLLVVCDTLRVDRLGSYGNGRDLTPNLDALAGEGVVFERAFSQSSLTMPSMAALMSGRTVDEIGIGLDNRWNLSEEVDTVAELVQGGGTRTAAVVSNTVLRAPDPEETGTRGIAQGFDSYDDEMPSQERNRHHRERVAADTTAAALVTIDSIVDEGRGDDFFLWVHYIDPHGPYTPPEPYKSRFDGGHEGGPELVIGQWNGGRGDIPNYQGLGGETRTDVYQSRYDAEVAYFDDAFGDLMAGLDERGLLEDTLIVFTADHGESMGENGWWFVHGQNLDAADTHVPLIVRFPGASERGRSVAPVQHLDVSTTILDAFGLRRRGDPRHSLFRDIAPEGSAAIQQLGRPEDRGRAFAVVEGQWRLVCAKDREPKLFDLLADPLEAHDLAAAHPDRVAELLARYRAETARLETDPLAPVGDAPSNAARDKELSALGYGR